MLLLSGGGEDTVFGLVLMLVTSPSDVRAGLRALDPCWDRLRARFGENICRKLLWLWVTPHGDPALGAWRSQPYWFPLSWFALREVIQGVQNRTSEERAMWLSQYETIIQTRVLRRAVRGRDFSGLGAFDAPTSLWEAHREACRLPLEQRGGVL